MFKCPRCGERMERVPYTRWGMRFQYFTCTCGWNNKPKDLPEEKEPEKE